MVDKGAPPPPELVLAWDCHQYGALPDSGGVLDQDFRLLRRMNTVQAIHSAFSIYRSASGEAIHRLPNWVGVNIAYLIENGIGVGLSG